MNETKEIIRRHTARVSYYLLEMQKMLFDKSQTHDESKLSKDEFPLFEKYAPLLNTCEYGSEKYKKYLEELQPALKHHYANNRHHPEHFENNIAGMNLIDLCEMFCDWLAAGEQHIDGGNIFKSIAINQARFGYGNEIKAILENTAILFKKRQ